MSGGISDSWTSVIYALSTTNLHGNITWTASAAVAWNRNGCASGDGRLPPGSAPRKAIAQTFPGRRSLTTVTRAMQRPEEVRMQNVLMMHGHGHPVSAIHLLPTTWAAIIDRVSGCPIW